MQPFQSSPLRTKILIAKITIWRIMAASRPFVVSGLTCLRAERGSRQRQMDR